MQATTLNGFVIAIGVGIAFFLLHMTSGGAPATQVQQWYARWWDEGMVNAACYVLVGPTIVGPMLVWLNGRSLWKRPFTSGAFLWVAIGFLLWPVISLMLAAWLTARGTSELQRLFTGLVAVVGILLGSLWLLFVLLGTTVVVSKYTIFLWQQRLSQEVRLLDAVGLTVGLLWSTVAIRIAYLAFYKPGLFTI